MGNLLDKDKNKEANALKSDANLTQAQKDSIAKAEQEEIKKNTITANQLIAQYKANEVSADNTFKGKTFNVSGKVADIKKDVLNHIYVTLHSDNIIRKVQCYFEDAETAAKLSKDMQVTFMGRCDGLMMNVLMKDCKLVASNQ
ncbi:OB-fold protein [Longitalea luteola]|uniref:OB-fold protein n=1 Tax=Longitalea luteola TaxID=2812563 RepID=UPI0034E1B8B9